MFKIYVCEYMAFPDVYNVALTYGKDKRKFLLHT